jgi:hypothetical protein
MNLAGGHLKMTLVRLLRRAIGFYGEVGGAASFNRQSR